MSSWKWPYTRQIRVTVINLLVYALVCVVRKTTIGKRDTIQRKKDKNRDNPILYITRPNDSLYTSLNQFISISIIIRQKSDQINAYWKKKTIYKFHVSKVSLKHFYFYIESWNNLLNTNGTTTRTWICSIFD